MSNDAYKQMYVDFHNRRAAEKGFTPEALWGSRRSQQIRFRVLTSMIRQKSGFSVLDVGCGLGDFYAHLCEAGFKDVRYTGLEFNGEFVREASARYPEARFMEEDLSGHVASAEQPYDYVIASGIYNLGEDRNETLKRIERDMRLVRRIVRVSYGVNFLSTSADTRDALSLYYDPAELFGMGRSIFGRHALLYHDYLPHDFTLIFSLNADDRWHRDAQAS